MEKPYELTTTSLANITRKTVFLLLLASGLRRNELHAIDVNMTIYYKDNHILLYPNDKFIAKNMKTKTGKGDFKGSLTDFVRPDLTKDALLCPVRCVKNYIKRTENRRGALRSLLITCNIKGPVREAHPNTISAWIESVIARAYEVDKDNPGPLLFRATDEIRAQSVSYAWYANVSIEQIVKECRWAQHSTFTNFIYGR